MHGLLYCSTGNLGGNIFTNSYLLAAAAVLQFGSIWYIKLGRRVAVSAAFIAAAVVSAAVLIFSLLGKLCACHTVCVCVGLSLQVSYLPGSLFLCLYGLLIFELVAYFCGLLYFLHTSHVHGWN